MESRKERHHLLKPSPFTHGLRNRLAVALGSFLTAILATGIHGDWLLFYIQARRLWSGESAASATPVNGFVHESENGTTIRDTDLLEKYYMKDVGFYIIQSLLGGFVILYGVGGWLKWHFYIQRRERAAEWKCQPDRFLTPEDDRLEFRLGSLNMAIGSILSGILSAYINNGGPTKFYHNIADYGWAYFLLSVPCLYVYNEAATYYSHKAMHFPPWYRRYHKVHHHFKCPTPFSAAAMHPYEFLIFQFLLEIPIFVMPIHAGLYIFWLLYGYYYGILSHSGINLDAVWPWQPPAIFHDDHHKYFHCNFGFNLTLFDKLHGTIRRSDRVYSETIFGGQGAPMQSSPDSKED